MSDKILWFFVGALTVACAGEGYYIYRHRPVKRQPPARMLAQARGGDPWRGLRQWRSSATKDLSAGAPIPFKDFDALFNDDFFSHAFDPFAEIENFQKKMAPFFTEDQRGLFGKSWGNWYDSRMGSAGTHTDIKENAKEIIVAFEIPGLQGESLNINVNKERIRASYDAKTVQEKKGRSNGAYFKSEAMSHFEKIMPIPHGADPDKYKIMRDGDSVKVIFQKSRT